MIDQNLEALLEKTRDVVLEAGEIVKDQWDKPKNIKKKGRIDLVTQTDVAVENFLKEKLAAILPGSAFLAEESAANVKPGPLTWIIDPVDGTTNYAHGLPHMCASVALWDEDRTVLGVVNAPILGECFTAIRGKGARLNGKPIAVSPEDSLEASLVATGFPYDVPTYLDRVLACMRAILPKAQGMRRAGAAALDMAYVSCGRLEAFYEATLNPWDVAAGWLLVTEAGGRVTQFDPDVPYALGALTMLCSNGPVHEEIGAALLSGWGAV
mgnify:CR=1 FL=1